MTVKNGIMLLDSWILMLDTMGRCPDHEMELETRTTQTLLLTPDSAVRDLLAEIDLASTNKQVIGR